MKKIFAIFTLLLILILPIGALADIDLDQDIPADQKQEFDSILEPVMKVYNFIKYSATVLGALFLVFAGISFMTASGDKGKREKAKDMAMYVVVGLIVIWITPLIINFVVG